MECLFLFVLPAGGVLNCGHKQIFIKNPCALSLCPNSRGDSAYPPQCPSPNVSKRWMGTVWSPDVYGYVRDNVCVHLLRCYTLIATGSLSCPSCAFCLGGFIILLQPGESIYIWTAPMFLYDLPLYAHTCLPLNTITGAATLQPTCDSSLFGIQYCGSVFARLL
jgi:hypothetical protein